MTRRLMTPVECERLRRLCQVHSIKVAAEIVGVSASSVRKLRRRGWVPAAHRRPPRPRPSDFVIQCEVMTKKELCRHYRAADQCVRRWSSEVGRVNQVPLRDRAQMAIQIPDGSDDAISRYGHLGTPDALAAIVARSGPYVAAEAYGVSYGTMKKWRRAYGLPISWSRRPGAGRERGPARPSQIGWADRLYSGIGGHP